MAKATQKKATSDVRVVDNDLRFHVVQQGRKYSVVESDETPDTAVEHGQRTKKVQGSYATREEADERAKFLAEHFQGEVE